jgi:hypothetical protein
MLAAAGIPVSFLPLLVFLWMARGVTRDLDLMYRHETPKNGIPHHGLLFLCAILAVGMSGIGFYQSFSVLNEPALATRFWILESVILVGILLMILLTMRLERRHAVLAQNGNPIQGGMKVE